jgi:oligopeptide transport system ATP-binding protein
MKQNNKIIDVKNLKMYFEQNTGLFSKKKKKIRAVDDISFFINKGETLGLVGESGCGKTTTGQCILQLYDITSGEIIFKNENLAKLSSIQKRKIRRHMQLIFQDPFASLDPRMTAGEIIGEPLIVHDLVEKNNYLEKVNELLNMVELEESMSERYPHEFSGGQRQRIGIARALAVRPDFIVCDEAVSALDVSIQAQIINLLIKLKNDHDLTYLFIAHDLSVVRNISDRVAVMYLGKIVEITSSDELYSNPKHPYTISLLSAVPIPDPEIELKRQRIQIEGDVPSPINPPSGCPFHTRCFKAEDICKRQVPLLKSIDDNHMISCHLV